MSGTLAGTPQFTGYEPTASKFWFFSQSCSTRHSDDVIQEYICEKCWSSQRRQPNDHGTVMEELKLLLEQNDDNSDKQC